MREYMLKLLGNSDIEEVFNTVKWHNATKIMLYEFGYEMVWKCYCRWKVEKQEMFDYDLKMYLLGVNNEFTELYFKENRHYYRNQLN